MADTYPVNLAIDYPDRKLNRLSSALRIFWVIPIAIVLVLLLGGNFQSSAKEGMGGWVAGIGIVGLIPTLLHSTGGCRWSNGSWRYRTLLC